MQSTQIHVNNLSYNISSATTREKELKKSLIKISNDITSKERELKNIRNQRDNKLVLFGDGIPKLVNEIEKNYQKVSLHSRLNRSLNHSKNKCLDNYNDH